MLKVTPIKGGKDAINYYAGLVRQEHDDGAWQESKEAGQGHVEDYYLPSPDEGGRWWGDGAKTLGVDGLGTREQLKALFAGQHLESGEQLGQCPRENTVRAYDLTFSAPKTVSLLASLCGPDTERGVIDAHEKAVKATLSLIQERTTTRAGRNGRIRLDIGGLAVLNVRHRTSRALDPQLHTHALLIARVQGSDGRWRSLDASTAMRGVKAFGAIYQSALRSELHRRFPGIAFGPVDRGPAEIAGLDDLARAFSKRRAQIEARYERLLADWRERHPDRALTRKAQGRLYDQAALATRAKKQHARTLEELRGEWLATARALGYDAPRLERDALHQDCALALAQPSQQEIARAAIAALSEQRSVFSREYVEREIAMRIDHTKGRSAGAQARAIEAVAGEAIRALCIDLVALGEEGQKRAAALAREPALERYTTLANLKEEQALCRFLEGAAAQGGEPASRAQMAGALASLAREDPSAPAPEPEQVRAAALIAGTHEACVVVGPAGAGKTSTLKLAARAIRQADRDVLVLAPWAKAAEAARRSTGLPSENVARYLTERARGDGMRAELRLRPGGT
ncbi:MAG: MobF family relaxase, partial [Solirubrobacteraceae bacterium]